jgi:hypothetical protein
VHGYRSPGPVASSPAAHRAASSVEAKRLTDSLRHKQAALDVGSRSYSSRWRSDFPRPIEALRRLREITFPFSSNGRGGVCSSGLAARPELSDQLSREESNTGKSNEPQ